MTFATDRSWLNKLIIESLIATSYNTSTLNNKITRVNIQAIYHYLEEHQ